MTKGRRSTKRSTKPGLEAAGNERRSTGRPGASGPETKLPFAGAAFEVEGEVQPAPTPLDPARFQFDPWSFSDLEKLPRFIGDACRRGEHALARAVVTDLLSSPLLEQEEKGVVHLQLAVVEAAGGNTAEALRIYRQLSGDLRLPSETRFCAQTGVTAMLQDLYEEGETAYWRMNYRRARSCFEALLQEPGVDAESREALRFNLGLVAKAEKEYRIILEDLRMPTFRVENR